MSFLSSVVSSLKLAFTYVISGFSFKVENILKGSLDLISSPSLSVQIQIMGGKVWLRDLSLDPIFLRMQAVK